VVSTLPGRTTITSVPRKSNCARTKRRAPLAQAGQHDHRRDAYGGADEREQRAAPAGAQGGGRAGDDVKGVHARSRAAPAAESASAQPLDLRSGEPPRHAAVLHDQHALRAACHVDVVRDGRSR
jgi:hypothetical protein